MRYYILEIKKSSQGVESREFTPYDKLETAQRKYHEALSSIGMGARRLAVSLLDENINIIKKEIWQKTVTVKLVYKDDVTNDMIVNAGDSVTLPTDETIKGWSLTPDSEEMVDNPLVVGEDVTLYAVYNEEV